MVRMCGWQMEGEAAANYPAMVDVECERCGWEEICIETGRKAIVEVEGSSEDGCRTVACGPPSGQSFEVRKKAIGFESSCG
jgi:hypothetical protein